MRYREGQRERHAREIHRRRDDIGKCGARERVARREGERESIAVREGECLRERERERVPTAPSSSGERR